MARLEVSGFDEFLSDLDDLVDNLDEIIDDCLDEAAPTLVESLKSEIEKAADRGYATGELAASIVPTRAKANAYGHFAAIRPVGEDERGVRNGEKLAYLEYGTSKQQPHPVMQKALKKAEPQTIETIQKRFEEHVDKIMK